MITVLTTMGRFSSMQHPPFCGGVVSLMASIVCVQGGSITILHAVGRFPLCHMHAPRLRTVEKQQQFSNGPHLAERRDSCLFYSSGLFSCHPKKMRKDERRASRCCCRQAADRYCRTVGNRCWDRARARFLVFVSPQKNEDFFSFSFS